MGPVDRTQENPKDLGKPRVRRRSENGDQKRPTPEPTQGIKRTITFSPPTEGSRQGANVQYERARETRTTPSGENSASERRPVRSRHVTALRPCPSYLRSRVKQPEGIPEEQRSNGHLMGRALDWYEIFGSTLVQNTATDFAQLKAALSKAFPVIQNRKDLETRFYASQQRQFQEPTDFVYDLLKLHTKLELGMSEKPL
ncbi:uncharacterized protein TNCV_4066291 [Trichonephila clavipes]|uniref:Retrotransposon gag domain-containing protein n=1 Tax=Trichonephila clavipes TaxID=2585209 RepID=A0A8X7BH70_TRICX|nr:uncharacterized protein TNCV_4066291 [Trichonephila clavipes]